MESVFRFLDVLFVPHFLVFLNSILKFNSRPLSPGEIEAAQTVFGNSINYQKVRVDTKAWLGCKQYHFAYVGFHVINCWGKLSRPLLIHELMHVWQYQRFGAVYIPRALYAQHSPEGYNYGGGEAIRQAALEGLSLQHFNWEQQADIVADYFCLQHDLKPRWCKFGAVYLPYFKKIISG